MFKKYLKSGYFQLIGMLTITICTQCISLLKGSITASIYGTSMEMDAYNLSSSIATFLFSFIGSGITVILIPNLVKKVNQKAINTFLTVLYGISMICILVCFIFRNYLLILFAHGNVSYLSIASTLMLFVLITQFMGSFVTVISAYFQCDGKYILPQIINLCSNIVLLFIIFLNRHNLSIYLYTDYILITQGLTLLVQILFFKKHKYSFGIALDLNDPDFRRMAKTFVPTLFSAGLYQVTLVTDSLISSTLGEGEISKLAYTNTIASKINDLFVSNLMTFIYPKITRNIQNEDNKSFLVQYMVLFFAVMMYVASAFMIGGKLAIALIYQHGNFSASTTDVVYWCCIIYLLGVPFNIMRDVLYRFFYSINDTLTPFKNGILASVLNFTVSIILAQFIGLYGVVLGTSVTSVYSFATISFRARKHLTLKDYQKLAIECMKIILVIGICFILFHNLVLFSNVYINFVCTEVINLFAFVSGIFLLRSIVFKIKL